MLCGDHTSIRYYPVSCRLRRGMLQLMQLDAKYNIELNATNGKIFLMDNSFLGFTNRTCVNINFNTWKCLGLAFRLHFCLNLPGIRTMLLHSITPLVSVHKPNPGVFQYSIKSWRPRQSGRHFPDDTFKRIFLNENVWISIKISLNCVPRGPINNIPALVQIMAWRRPGDKPLFEPMMVCLLTHICVTRPQWVKCFLKDTYQCLHDNIWMLHGEADLYSEIYWIRL